MNNEITDLVVKYIVGQASDDEIAAVKQWINLSKENEDYYIELYEAWHNSLQADPHLINSEQAYRSFIQQAGGKRSLYKRLPGWSRFAAAAVLTLMCSVGGYFFYQQYAKPDVWYTVNVANGGTKKLVLSDGTTVWINAGSHIKYDDDFGRGSRVVYLDGEAYFDIAKSKKKIPFLVKTKHFVIRDIGTVFNIKAYSDDPSFEATVIEGKISVEGKLSKHDDENSKVFLERKQVLKINSGFNADPENETVSEQPESRSNPERIKILALDESQIQVYNGWKDDFLVFEETTFKELAKIIERRYDVEMVLEGEALQNYKYTGSFRNVESITKVMNIIKATTAINYQINGRTVVISESKSGTK